MSRKSDRKKRAQKRLIYHINLFNSPDISDISRYKRILRNGPELVGALIMTRWEAYWLFWQRIFDEHKKDNRFPKNE